MADDGTYSDRVEVRVRCWEPPAGSTAQPLPEPCVLRVNAGWADGDVSLDGKALEFDPDGPVLPSAVARIVPRVGIADGELIRLLGSDFDPGNACRWWPNARQPGDGQRSFDR